MSIPNNTKRNEGQTLGIFRGIYCDPGTLQQGRSITLKE